MVPSRFPLVAMPRGALSAFDRYGQLSLSSHPVPHSAAVGQPPAKPSQPCEPSDERTAWDTTQQTNTSCHAEIGETHAHDTVVAAGADHPAEHRTCSFDSWGRVGPTGLACGVRSLVEQAAVCPHHNFDHKEKRLALRGRRNTIGHAVAEVGHIFQPSQIAVIVVGSDETAYRLLSKVAHIVVQHNPWLKGVLS